MVDAREEVPRAEEEAYQNDMENSQETPGTRVRSAVEFFERKAEDLA